MASVQTNVAPASASAPPVAGPANVRGNGGAALASSAAAARPSDDEILGIEPASGGASPPAGANSEEGRAASESGASERGAESQDGSARAAAEAAANPAAEPAELKAILDANPALRRAWQGERAYREIFSTVAEARELKKLFPTLAEARAAQENIGELQRFDRQFFSANPSEQAELVASLHRLDPQAFRGMAQVLPQVLSRVDPEAYRADTAARIEATLADVRADAARRGDAALVAATDLLAQRIFGGDTAAWPTAAAQAAPAEGVHSAGYEAAREKPGAARPTGGLDLREVALARREQALAQREAAALQQARAAFYEDSNAAVVQGVVEAIRQQVAELVPEEVSEAARNRVVAEIYREIDAKLRDNPQLAHQLRQAFVQGAYDSARREAVVNLVLGRARHVLPQVAKKVIGEWTSSVLASSRQKAARQRAAAARVDISGGGPPGSLPRRPPSPREMDYARLSDMDILNL